ncbi:MULTISPECIES: hypothetical protein [Streptomyces]|uniref:hypothetical protein n=1 Tax=Streptomyces TaxID=1883 RepID=UPI0004CCE383|nr:MULTISPECIES: hypothetical protein [Streptomyces]KOT47264.1 hypothetical protein ADK43_39915 [Streptomyces rimosus subsp. rimosus]
MVSLLEELERREAAIRERVSVLRFQAAELSDQLAAFEEMLAQVEVARMVVREVLDDAAADEVAPRKDTGPAEAGSPIGVVTVPPWEPGMGISVLSEGYRDVMGMLRAAGRPMRSKAVSVAIRWGEGAAEWGEGAAKVESVRAKLKRLARGELAHRGQPGPVRTVPARRGTRAAWPGLWRMRALLPNPEVPTVRAG